MASPTQRVQERVGDPAGSDGGPTQRLSDEAARRRLPGGQSTTDCGGGTGPCHKSPSRGEVRGSGGPAGGTRCRQGPLASSGSTVGGRPGSPSGGSDGCPAGGSRGGG